MIKKAIGDKPRKWHEVLSEVLQAYRNSKCTATSLTPYRLTYGHDMVLLMETTVRSLRVTMQNKLELDDYHKTLFMEMDSTDED